MSPEKRGATSLTPDLKVRYLLGKPMKLMTRLAFAAFLFSSSILAAAPDVSGKWKWIYQPDNGDPIDVVMNLKQEDSKLSGVIDADSREMKVQEGKISSDGVVTFFITIELDSGPLKIDFNGKVDGDIIKGKTQFQTGDGEKRESDWQAKRDQARNLTGKWNSVFKRQDGTPMETTLQLKQAGDKLTGTQSFNDNESEIRDGKVQGNEVTFRIVRERDGRTVTSKYKGKIQPNNSIKGEIESDWTGEVRRLEWEAKKAN